LKRYFGRSVWKLWPFPWVLIFLDDWSYEEATVTYNKATFALPAALSVATVGAILVGRIASRNAPVVV
jgi:hypothetical protein